MTQLRFFISAFLSTALALGACGDSKSNNTPTDGSIGGEAKVSQEQCSYNGKVYVTGDVFCATDGCNSCQCHPEGTVGVGCTQKDCSAAGVVIAGVCQLGDKQLAECPRQSDGGTLAFEIGGQCPSEFDGCNLTTGICKDYRKCACVDNKVDCWPSIPRDGNSCSDIEPGSGEICGGEITDPSDIITFGCRCKSQLWSCSSSDPCPREEPQPGSQCDAKYYSNEMPCSYPIHETECAWLELKRHCTCKDGNWDCQDEGDCRFVFSDASVPDGGA